MIKARVSTWLITVIISVAGLRAAPGALGAYVVVDTGQGTCFGDSGGPDLLGESDTVLAVNSYVTNYNCAGVGYSSRVDIPEVLDWIYSFFS